MYRAAVWGARIAILALVFGLWEWGVATGRLDAFFYGSPSTIWGVIHTWLTERDLLRHAGITISSALVGYVVGALSGTVLGVLFATRERLGRVMEPFMAAANGVPRLTLVPFFIIWLGTGMSSKVALAAVVVVFLVFFTVYNGMRNINPNLIMHARQLGAGRLQLATNVYIPAIVVWLISGLRTSLGFAFSAAVVGEYLGSRAGLGWLILQGMSLFRTREVLAGLTVVLVVVMAIDWVLRLIERRATVWAMN